MKVKLILLLILFLSSYESKKKIETLTTIGTRFKLGGYSNCMIDGQPVTCETATKAFDDYKSTILKCNPAWLIQKGYDGKKFQEGYAIHTGNGSHHHYWLGEYITYDSNGDTLKHMVDTSVVIDDFILKKPEDIRKYLLKNGLKHWIEIK